MKKRITGGILRIMMLIPILAVLAAGVYGQVKLGPRDGAGLPAADLERIKPGDAAPDFTLENHDSRTFTLSDYKGKEIVVLVFYRGYW